MQAQKHQISYERGIVENVAQHLVGQQGMEASLLWLENYNPNIEHKSLIKRLQQEPYWIPSLNWKNVSAGVLTAKKGIAGNHVLHCATALLTANPESNETFVVFGDRLVDGEMHTAVVSHNLEYDPDNNIYEPRWRYPHVNTILNTLSNYKGWSPRGIFQDFSRFSESLLFVTLPREIDNIPADQIAACYKWFWFDITKKRLNENKWWEGLTFNNLTDKEQSTWIVKSPTKVLSESVSIKQYSPAMWVLPPTTGIELVVAENDLVAYDYINETIAYEGMIQSCADMQPYSGHDEIRFSHLFHETNLLLTFSVPKNKWYRDIIEAHTCQYNPGSTGKGYHIIPCDIHLSSRDWDNDIVPGTLVASDDIALHTDRYPITHSNCSSFFDADNIKDYGVEDSRPYLPAMITALPRYISLNIPRCWLPGEEVPVIITANIRGVETIILQDTYTVNLKDHAGNNKTGTIVKRFRTTGLSSSVEADYGMNSESNITNYRYFDENQAGGENKFKYYRLRGSSTRITASPVGIFGCPMLALENDYLVFSSALTFTIRIADSMFSKIVEQDITSLNIYVSAPSERNGLVKTEGILAPQTPQFLDYKFPAVNDFATTEEKLSQYRLVKKFVIEGSNLEPQWDIYNGSPFNTNSWKQSSNGFVYATPVDNDGNPDDSKQLSFIIQNGTTPSCFTPDFILWDYPTDSEPLNLEFSGKTWNGKGARLITVVKGEVFLGGCADEHGQEEQGTVRYCLFQSGVPLYDIFPLENKIQIGHLPHTALVEYREQLIWFNKQQHFRMIMPSIFEPATWEFLDSVDGGGTFSQKTVCKTPNGIAYCNESGIWLTDGRIPENLTDQPEQMFSVRANYEHIMKENVYEVKHLWNFGVPIINSNEETTIDENYKHNYFAELTYDDVNDELVLSSPLYRYQSPLETLLVQTPTTYHDFTHEIRLIFSFAKKNWRTEVFPLNGQIYEPVDNDYFWRHSETYLKQHRAKITNAGIISTVLQWSPFTNANKSIYTDAYTDLFIYFRKQSTSDMPLSDTYRNHDMSISEYSTPIIGMFVTHILGNNMDDALLRRFILGTVPRGQHTTQAWRNWTNYTYDITADNSLYTLNNNDPIFAYNRRSENYASQRPLRGNPTTDLPAGWIDLMAINMSKYPSAQNPWFSSMQTPGGINWQAIDVPLARESLIMHAPINTPFRRLQLLFASEVVVKMHDILAEYNIMRRRTI